MPAAAPETLNSQGEAAAQDGQAAARSAATTPQDAGKGLAAKGVGRAAWSGVVVLLLGLMVSGAAGFFGRRSVAHRLAV